MRIYYIHFIVSFQHPSPNLPISAMQVMVFVFTTFMLKLLLRTCVPILSQPPVREFHCQTVPIQISPLVTYSTYSITLANTDPYCRSTSGTACWPTTQTTTAAASLWTGSSTPPAVSAGTLDLGSFCHVNLIATNFWHYTICDTIYTCFKAFWSLE